MTSGRIDTHQHIIPPEYRRLLDERGLSAGRWPTPEWAPEAALALMDSSNIATGILSVSSPGVHLGPGAEGRTIARRVNTYTAEVVKDRPDRFGCFAGVPLPDVDGSLEEIAHAFDEIGADGVVLMSHADGKYLGHKDFEPLWEELDARNAVVFIHPTSPPMEILDGLPSPILDFPFDTTRTAIHMVANGVLRRHKRVRVILSHAGGFLPYAAYRFIGAAQFNSGIAPEEIFEDMKRFYFDTAVSSTPVAMPSLLAFADPTRITYGSDFPYVPSSKLFDAMLENYPLSEEQRFAIDRGNALALFPRLAQ
ncbi:amidohydrolase family protein [Nocardia zapadnayensis]|uniref:amidohydrolase family protein n=1 Tax=Nocardia rhamnosiphila TaxID=426716 RepID=UPI00224729BE|nr:amidohydrolase family protein [Nocardia zapadnayensis]MCX0275154.1 amidohydrolase family protein [Nocardia zapadnayensis]